MVQPNPNVTQALTAAVANYSSQLADDVTNNNPLLSHLKKRGNFKTFDGGPEIYENILHGEAAAKGWYNGSEVLSTADQDVMTTATFAFRQFYTNVTLSGKEQIENAGKGRMHNLFEGKLDSARASMENSIAEALYYSNTENAGKSIGGLQHLVSDSPSTPTVGGIDASSSDHAFWRNYVFDFSANSLTASASTILTALNTSFLNTNRNTEKVDLVIGGTTYFQYFEASQQSKQRFMDADLANAGFENYKYKSAMVMHDPNCSDTRMYGLNTKYIFFRPYESRNFTQGDRKHSLNQDLFLVPMYFAGNLTLTSRQRQFVIIA